LQPLHSRDTAVNSDEAAGVRRWQGRSGAG